jgi:UDP-2,4-diacetamido-2,4,6-trideoxy-beta-L-altropyranose hydrolase
MSFESPSVALRVDASTAIGLGHLKRCLALAYALREAGARVIFVVRSLGLEAAAMVKSSGFELRRLPAPGAAPPLADGPPHAHWAAVAWADDADQTATALDGERLEWLVVDHYSFDARWHGRVGAALGTCIAVIDDLADRNLECQLLVDHNLARDHADKYRGRVLPATRVLGGPRFALLAPAYLDAPSCPMADPVRSIGIFMGGADAAGLAPLAVEACRQHAGYRGPIEVVATSASPQRLALEALARRDPQLRLTFDLPDLAAFFARHDLQIGAGGGATWERCRTGAPSLTVAAADNQRVVIPALVEQGVTVSLAPDAVVTAAALAEPVRMLLADAGLRRALGERARRLVDGFGARRVGLALLAASITVRSATADDAGQLFAWRNHPQVRAVSRNTAPIDKASHHRWLARTLVDPQRLLLIGEVGSLDVGTARFDLDEPTGSAEVSIHLDPAYVGLGLGASLLAAAEARARERLTEARRFVATVLDGNDGSHRLFGAAGYRPANGHWEKECA